MIGNISYLSEYEPYDRGYVSFGQGGGKITSKGIIKTGKDFKLKDDTNVLLRTPRQHNMYSIYLNNIVSHKNLTCLVAKASINESMLWHRRLGHLNFKTMNKLVRNNLVKGLPSKCFKNDHTCVACLNEKQHKASCKTKLVNSVSKPLHTLHMDLFGPTSVSSLNHKWYCLVMTDDFSRFTWTFFLRTKDETSSILRNFITEIENLKDQNVKIISNARTLQQNRVAERKNRTLIVAAKTMLTDAKLPVTFWAEAVNTACYVQNRVLVNKFQNKTPYELFNSRIPAIGFLRPFGCHVIILNTLDNLGKFDVKGDEGYFVGYSMSSITFRVFNKRTKKVEENLHVDFLKNKLIEKGAGPNWLFNIDTLTNSMNYVPVVVAGTTSTNISGTQDVASQAVKKDMSSLRYIALPNWFHEAHIEIRNSDGCNANDPESSGISNPTATSKVPSAEQVEPAVSLTVETKIPAINSHVPTVCLDISPESSSDPIIISKGNFIQKETPPLGNALTLSNRFEDTFGEEADLSNMETSIPEELLQFKIQNVWILVDCPNWVRPIGTKWVLKNKKDERGIVIRNKARVVAQGYTLEEGIDYKDVFAPVARIEAIRLFLAYDSFMCFILYQMDVKSVFLYGTIDEEVFVVQPLGFQDPEFPDRVYKVEKAMYGLHQAPRAWYGTLSKYLLDNSFQRGTIDQTMFIKKHKGDFLLVQVYVDDIIFGSLNPQLCKEFEALMHEKFQMSAMGELTFFLGLQVRQNKDGIFLLQDKYVGDILKKFGYSDVRPDIMFAVCACARHQVTPKECHLHAVKRIFIYLKGHPKLGLWYPKDSYFDLVACSNSDYGSATQDRKSTTEDDNVADLLTKPFDAGRFQYLVGKGSTTPTEPHHIPSPQEQHLPHHDPSSPSHPTTTTEPIPQTPTKTPTETPTLRRYTRRAIRIAQSKALSPAVDEPASLLRDDRQGKAFPTISSLDARQDMEKSLRPLPCPMNHHQGLHMQQTQMATKIKDQDLEISGLKERVKFLEDKDRGSAEPTQEDAPIKGGIMEKGEEVGADKSTELGSDNTDEMVNVLSSIEAANILTSGDSTVSVSPVAGVSTKCIPFVSGLFPTASAIFTTANVEQVAADLSIGEKIELINELVKYQDHHTKILKYQAQQSKPLLKKEQREFYMSVLKSHVGWKTRHFRGITLEKIKEKFIHVWKQLEDFVPMSSKEEGKRVKRQGLKINQGSSKRMQTSKDVSEEDLKGMMQLVPLEEVEDLHQLWTLVKETLSIKQATKGKEKELWVELKRFFEPDFKDQLWTHNQALMHDPLEWKLYDTYGIHQTFTKDQDIFMLVEKDYPLRKGLATVMICNKLQVEQYSQMANDLILKIHNIANSPR
nr:hypothetical protein [Tanacetum cinerariifolium]